MSQASKRAREIDLASKRHVQKEASLRVLSKQFRFEVTFITCLPVDGREGASKRNADLSAEQKKQFLIPESFFRPREY